MIKVLLAEDDNEFRGILRDALRCDDILSCEAPDGRSALKIFESEHPDAALLDMKMPGLDGLETMKELRKMDSGFPVLILTGYGDIEAAVEAMKAGAFDFIAKPPDFGLLAGKLKNAVKWAKQGKATALSESPVEFDTALSSRQDESGVLTAREREILVLTVKGATCTQIAERLSISHRTVETHLYNLMQKLGLHNRADLTRYAVERGISVGRH